MRGAPPDAEGQAVDEHADAGAVADLAGPVRGGGGDVGEEALAPHGAVELEAERVGGEPGGEVLHAAAATEGRVCR